MQEIKQRIGYIIIMVAALVVIAVTWIRFDEPSFDAPQGDVVSEDNIDTTPETELPNNTNHLQTELPDFIVVNIQDGKKVITHKNNGYQISIYDNWIPTYNNMLSVVTSWQVPSGELTADFSLIHNPMFEESFDREVQDWLERYNSNDTYCESCYKKFNEFVLEGKRVVVIKDTSGMGERYTYIFQYENKIVEIHANNMTEDDVIYIINNFKLI